MEGPGGGSPRPVTGDIDLMAILDESGAFIRDKAKRIQIYRQLAELIEHTINGTIDEGEPG